jgi:hypothetical protein
MKRHGLVVAGLLLAGCDRNPAHQQETVARVPPLAAPAATEVQRPAVAADAGPYTILPGFGDSTRATTRIRINNEPYRVQTSAVVDRTQPVRYTPPPTAAADDSVANTPETGFEGIYTFRLVRPDGQPQFVRRLKKSAFAAQVGEDMAVISGVSKPLFLGYLPEFKALAFELSLYPPDSDNGGELLLLLDASTGRVLHQGLARWTTGCNSSTVLSSNGRTLLTSSELLQANGHVTNLEKPGRTVAGTLLVNDQTALVVYDDGYDKQGQEVPLEGPPAELIDAKGHLLKALNLESTDVGLGSKMLTHYLGQTRTHYLFDEANGKLGLIPRDQPARLRVVKLNHLPRFRAPQRPGEVRIAFHTETGTQAAFYVDTVSGKLRYRLRKPGY